MTRSERTLTDRFTDWLDGTVWLSEYVRVSPRMRVSVDVRHYLRSPRVQAQVAACRDIKAAADRSA